jgi:phosphoribosylanthranilate isomerase
MPTKIKICGVTSIEAVKAAIKARVDYIGCVFYKHSPRNITPAFAKFITQDLPLNIKKVAVVVSPSISELKEIVKYFRPDILQFDDHEPPEFIAKIKKEYGLPVVKTIFVHRPEDLKIIEEFTSVADMFLFDAAYGNDMFIEVSGKTFDWGILKKSKFTKPWILAGGLTKYNVNQAKLVSGAKIVSVSATLESSPGIKDSNMIEEFVKAIRIPSY